VLACVIGGVVLRFQPQPYALVGGGLILLGFLLFAVIAKRRR